MEKILSVIFVFGFSAILFSQTITVTGVVKDSKSGNVLPYTNILVQNTSRGTVTNQNGRFSITLDSSTYKLVVTYIGYKTQIISVDKSVNLEVRLIPTSIEMQEVVVSGLTWAEQFIVDAVKVKNEQNQKLNHFTADAYSKTIFSSSALGIFGLNESISQIQYLKPGLHGERLLVYKASPNLKNIPYRFLAVNHSMNIYEEKLRINNLIITSPLNDNCLQYYNFELKGKTLVDVDTVVILTVASKETNTPLLEGVLYFLADSHRLIEADLRGNSNSKDALIDSLRLYQIYSIKHSIFNLPSFTKYSVRMNYMGLGFSFAQEYTFVNYKINDETGTPFVSADNRLIEEPNLNIDFDFRKNQMFNVPLTEKEEAFNETAERVFVKAPFYRKVLLAIFNHFLPVMFDQPMNIAGYSLSKFSNLYRFNKAEGHYAGVEYQFLNDNEFNFYARAGYAFAAKLFEYNLSFRWNRLAFNAMREIRNLGEFPYIQSNNTLNALFYHKDDIHYIKLTGINLKYIVPLSSKFTITPFVEFEKQVSMTNNTEFSFFKRDELFKSNYVITDYTNNKTGFSFSYIENPDQLSNDKRTFKGESFVNMVLTLNVRSKNILNATEDNTEYFLSLFRHQEIYYPLSADVMLYFRHVTNSNYLNTMEFVSNSQILVTKQSPLTVFTLQNYEYYLQNYFLIKSSAALFNLPRVLDFQMSVGGIFTFMNPYSIKDMSRTFEPLKKSFYEYGISITGISMLNLYLLKNNFNPKDVFLRIDLSF